MALVDEGTVLDSIDDSTPGAADRLVATIDQLVTRNHCDTSQISLIAVGVGPGPYTSTRVGVMVATTLGLTLDVSVVGVCTLDAIAFAANQSTALVVATDARRKEIYWARYDATGQRTEGPAVAAPQQVSQLAGAMVAGGGLDRTPELIEELDVTTIPVTNLAASIGQLAHTELSKGTTVSVAGDLVEHGRSGQGSIPIDARLFAPRPLYLRRPDAVAPKQSTLSIRPMRWPDIEQVAELEQQLFPDDSWNAESFWGELAGMSRDIRRYWVALRGSVVVGYAGASRTGDSSDVQTIAVTPAERRSGMGRQLLQLMLDWIDTGQGSAGGSPTFLEVAADNSAAIALYESAGFAVTDTRAGYYRNGVDALIMMRPRRSA